MVGGGSTALRKFVTDSVNNATQDANYKGVLLPFYTVGSSQGKLCLALLCSLFAWVPAKSELK